MTDDTAHRLRDADPVRLGERLRAARRSRGLTQAQVVGPDASVAYLSRIESGQRRPDVALLHKLAERLTTPVDALLDEAPLLDPDEVRLLLDYAELALESGEADEAERRCQALLDDGSASAAGAGTRATYLHARALEAQGHLDAAILELERLPRSDGSDLPWVRSRIALSRCYRESGDLTKAVECGEESLAVLDDRGLAGCDEAVQLAVTVAAAYFERGDRGQAVRMCRTATEHAEATGSTAARAAAYWNASLMEAERGSTGAAVRLAERALALLGEGSDTRNLARLRTTLGDMYLSLDEPEVRQAESVLRQAAEDLEGTSAGQVDRARNQLARARARLLAGDPETARTLGEAVVAAVADSAPLLVADAHVIQGRAAAALGDDLRTRDCYRRAILVLSSIGADRGAAELWYELGSLVDELGDVEAARDAYRRAAAASGLRVPSGHRVTAAAQQHQPLSRVLVE